MNALESLLSQFDPATIQRMAGQIGATPQQTTQAIQAALPLLLGGLQRNAQSGEGAQALHRAVTRDHQGVDLNGLLGGLLGGTAAAGQLGGLLGGSGSAASSGAGGLLGAVMGAMGGTAAKPPARSPVEEGMAILGHVFGQRQPRAAQGVAQASGLDPQKAATLMAMLAPMLMGVLGQATQQRKLDANGLSAMLGQAAKGLGQGGPGLQQVLGKVLDRDGDGKVDASELLQQGASLLQGFLRR